jgi:hypothetical protein
MYSVVGFANQMPNGKMSGAELPLAERLYVKLPSRVTGAPRPWSASLAVD